jgi:hypothetical protein
MFSIEVDTEIRVVDWYPDCQYADHAAFDSPKTQRLRFVFYNDRLSSPHADGNYARNNLAISSATVMPPWIFPRTNDESEYLVPSRASIA